MTFSGLILHLPIRVGLIPIFCKISCVFHNILNLSQYSSLLETRQYSRQNNTLPVIVFSPQGCQIYNMKALNLLAVTIAALSASGVSAISLAPRSSSPRVVSLDVQRRGVDPLDHDKIRRRKRAGTVTEILANEETLYFANITLGTPPQSLR
jgi:hypothetical protein